MGRIIIACLTALIICLSGSGCASPPVLITPQVELPARPELLDVSWTHGENLHCLTDAEAKNLLINMGRMQNHIETLEQTILIIQERE